MNWHHDDLIQPDQWWGRFRGRARLNGPARMVARICIVAALALALIDVARGRFGWWSAIDFWLSLFIAAALNGRADDPSQAADDAAVRKGDPAQ